MSPATGVADKIVHGAGVYTITLFNGTVITASASSDVQSGDLWASFKFTYAGSVATGTRVKSIARRTK